MVSCYGEYQKLFFDFDFPSPRFCRFKNVKFYFRSCQKQRKGRTGHSHVVTSYQERSRCQNKLRGPHCGDLTHFIFLYYLKLLMLQVIWAVLWSFWSPSNANRQLLGLKAKQNSRSRKKLFRNKRSLLDNQLADENRLRELNTIKR